MDKRDFEDFMYRRQGTIMGDHGRMLDNSPGKYVAPGPPRVHKGPSKPWFPGVDRWFDAHLSMRARRTIALLLAIVGARWGYGSAAEFGFAPWHAATLGGIAGGLLLPLFMVAVKLALLALWLGVIARAIYLIGSAL